MVCFSPVRFDVSADVSSACSDEGLTLETSDIHWSELTGEKIPCQPLLMKPITGILVT